MKRVSIAAALLLAASTQSFAQTAPQATPDLGAAFTTFRQNAIDMGLKGDMAGVKTLLETTIDSGFKGQHNIALSLSPAGGDTDIGALQGKPGALVISSPILSLSFGVSTTKDGYMNLINGANSAASGTAPPDAQIAVPALLNNTTLKAEVQSVETAPDGNTATVKNTITGAINADGVMKALGYPGLPPMLGGLDLTVKLDCTTGVKLDGKGGFTVTGETCTGGLAGVAKPNLPTGPRPGPHP